ncbi:MAG: hypothetical protein R3C44_14315 [Chloroflexota bacterium]
MVICSIDEAYPDIVPPLAGAIKEASLETAVLLAGRPGEREAAYREAGVDAFIYLGADCLDINRRLLAALTSGGHYA